MLFRSESFNNFLATAKATLTGATDLTSLVPSTDSTVIEGYKAIYQSYVDKVWPDSGLVEILFSINSPGTITIQAAIQTPLSQGRLFINSSSIFDPPVIDPWYFSNPAGAFRLCSASEAHVNDAPCSPKLNRCYHPPPSVEEGPVVCQLFSSQGTPRFRELTWLGCPNRRRMGELC